MVSRLVNSLHRGLQRSICLGGCLLGLAIALPAGAQPDRLLPGGAAELVPVQNVRVSVEQAMNIAARAAEGRPLRADIVMHNGRQAYAVLVYREDGVVRTVHIDAESGAVL